MAGLVIENVKTIVLDSKNAHVDGPNGLFRIVVDQFNTDAITRWHIEDKYGEVSRNLGGNKCRSLDAIVGRVGGFVFDDAIKQLKWTHPRQVNNLIQEIERIRTQ